MNCVTGSFGGLSVNDGNLVTRIFLEARSQNGWLDRPVSDDALRQVWELARWAPTSANSSPMRVKFVRPGPAQDILLDCLDEGNVEKVRSAPVTAIIGYDLEFYEHFELLFPHRPAVRERFAGPQNTERARMTAIRNGTLQAGFFILAARAVGLDCGPLSGFDEGQVDRAFWQGTKVRSNFLCSLGHGDPAKLFPRHPRFGFDDVCEIL